MGKFILFESSTKPIVKSLQYTGCLPLKQSKNGRIEPIDLWKSIIGYIIWTCFSIIFLWLGGYLTILWSGLSNEEFTQAWFSFVMGSMTTSIALFVAFLVQYGFHIWSLIHARLRVNVLSQLLNKLGKNVWRELETVRRRRVIKTVGLETDRRRSVI